MPKNTSIVKLPKLNKDFGMNVLQVVVVAYLWYKLKNNVPLLLYNIFSYEVTKIGSLLALVYFMKLKNPEYMYMLVLILLILLKLNKQYGYVELFYDEMSNKVLYPLRTRERLFEKDSSKLTLPDEKYYEDEAVTSRTVQDMNDMNDTNDMLDTRDEFAVIDEEYQNDNEPDEILLKKRK